MPKADKIVGRCHGILGARKPEFERCHFTHVYTGKDDVYATWREIDQFIEPHHRQEAGRHHD